MIETIQTTYDPEVVFITWSFQILNDAILEDAVAVGIDTAAQVMENGIREPLPGTMLTKVSPEVRGLLDEADLVIAEEGGNHNTLTDEEALRGKVSYLFQAKCCPYCTIHKAPLGALLVCNA